MALDAVFLAEIYLLTQLAPVFRRDAHLLIYDDSCNGLLPPRALNLGYYKDVLPQGAPSSPAITNLIMFSFDEHLGQWCRERNIAYTRYCDDMTFSGDFDPAEVTDFVRSELKKLGFLLNEQKTQVQRPGWQQSVTGIPLASPAL